MTNVPKTWKSRHGFTIVELMVTLAVAAILIGFALPAFNDFVSQRTMAARSNDFVLAVAYARSEAIRRGSPVNVQANAGAGGGNEWGGGFCVVLAGSDCDDANDVLRRFDEAGDDMTFNAIDDLHNEFTLSFNSRGMLRGIDPGTFQIELCHTDEDIDPGRVISLSPTGRADSQELDCHA